jgi:hypothetical protein
MGCKAIFFEGLSLPRDKKRTLFRQGRTEHFGLQTKSAYSFQKHSSETSINSSICELAFARLRSSNNPICSKIPHPNTLNPKFTQKMVEKEQANLNPWRTRRYRNTGRQHILSQSITAS